MTVDYFQLVRRGAIGDIRSSIDHRQAAGAVNEYGQTLLHEAIAHKRPFEVVELLIDLGAPLNAQDNRGLTPLHYCAEWGQHEVGRLLIRLGADVSISDCHGNQPLWTAVFNARGTSTFVQELLRAGADAAHKNMHNVSPLDFARKLKDAKLVNLFGGDGKS